MELEIKKYDHNGRGISYIDNKIIFIENTIPGEIVEAEITHETSKYSVGKVTKFVKKSPSRVKSRCPFYPTCGGCHLRHLSYDDTLEFKKNKVSEILEKYADIKTDINIIKNKERDFYRNKIEIQVRDGIYGFFKSETHEVVEIDRCLNAEESINGVLLSIELLHLENGIVTIKSNYNGEIIISIKTEEEPVIEIEKLRDKCKLVGIILNDKLIFGADHFIEIVNNKFFKETYNSFFQVNRYINSELFKLLESNIDADSTVLDLCSGVGTLSIVASSKAKKVYAIEIVENAVRDALINAKMNKITNIDFMMGDAFTKISKIQDKIDTMIVDPPRSGLTKDALASIKEKEIEKIIYISCDPVTLARDLSSLKEYYNVKKVYLLDMFSYTYHVECVCVLCLR